MAPMNMNREPRPGCIREGAVDHPLREHVKKGIASGQVPEQDPRVPIPRPGKTCQEDEEAESIRTVVSSGLMWDSLMATRRARKKFTSP